MNLTIHHLVELVQKFCDDESVEVRGDTRLEEDLHLDSIDQLSLLTFLEEELGVDLLEHAPDHGGGSSVRDLHDWLSRAQGSHASHPEA